MAGQADKKRAKAADSASRQYTVVIIAAAILHLIGAWYRGCEPSWGRIFAFLWFNGLNYLAFISISSAVRVGVSYAYYQDLLILNVLVELLSVLHPIAWAIYLIIPGYFAYHYGGTLFDFAPKAPTKEQVENEAKRERKRATKEKKQKVKYVKA
eukprot:Trichotokara_eunicae@DN6241_c0_g1_i1.p1